MLASDYGVWKILGFVCVLFFFDTNLCKFVIDFLCKNYFDDVAKQAKLNKLPSSDVYFFICIWKIGNLLSFLEIWKFAAI